MSFFLQKIRKPIIALAPMDGVTDHPMRYIYAQAFKPDLFFTEFINVQAVLRGGPKVYEKLRFKASEKPIICQLSGQDTESYYQACQIALFLGFDGIDINLGCPSKKVVRSGGGSALIGKKIVVSQIISECRHALSDFDNSFDLDKINIKNKVKNKLLKLKKFSHMAESSFKPTLSVKTRLDETPEKTQEWVSFLLKHNLDFISIHARTAKQGYKGKADWIKIKEAVILRNKLGSKSLIFGNGDIKDQPSIVLRVKETGVNGALIGRGAMGNPWIFSKSVNKIRKKEKIELMLKHATYFNKIYPKRFLSMRKHFGWYCKGFAQAKNLRIKLFKSSSLEEVKKILSS